MHLVPKEVGPPPVVVPCFFAMKTLLTWDGDVSVARQACHLAAGFPGPEETCERRQAEPFRGDCQWISIVSPRIASLSLTTTTPAW